MCKDKSIQIESSESSESSDLSGIPYISSFLFFARGCQRVVWSIFTIILDWNVFSSEWKLQVNTPIESAFFVINILVLGFLFGEVALKNMTPSIEIILKILKSK